MDLRAAYEALVAGCHVFLWWLSDDPALGTDIANPVPAPCAGGLARKGQ